MSGAPVCFTLPNNFVSKLGVCGEDVVMLAGTGKGRLDDRRRK